MRKQFIPIAILFLAMSSFASLKIAGLYVSGTDFTASTDTCIRGLLAIDSTIDLIIGPSEGLCGDSAKGRISFKDSSGYIVPFLPDTFYNSRRIFNTIQGIRVLALRYRTTILPGTIFEVDNFNRCFEAMIIIGSDGHIERVRRKAHKTVTDPNIDAGIRPDNIVTHDGSVYTYLLTISNESRDLPIVYDRFSAPADIWLMSARHWALNFDRAAKEAQNSCPPNWTTVLSYFPLTNFQALVDSNWVKPTAPLMASVLLDTAGATFVGNLISAFRPYDDWYVFHDYRITNYGTIVTCDPDYPPRTLHGLVVKAIGHDDAPVESLRVLYGPSGTTPTSVGYTDEKGLFQFHTCFSDSFYLMFSLDTFPLHPADSIVFVNYSLPRCTVYVNVRIDTHTITGENRLPEELSLLAIPNPFNSTLTIKLGGLRESEGVIEIFDISGRRVDVLNIRDKDVDDGNATLRWAPSGEIGSGIYFVKLTESNRNIINKVIFLK